MTDAMVGREQKTTPAFQQVIKALQPTSAGSTTITLPDTVTSGGNFQVNIVQDSENLNTILAQSVVFTIASASSSSSSVASCVCLSLFSA
jgi:hypothetical protein